MITILTPTYNRANTLPKLYKSLIDQTNHNFEWLVIDDGSTDSTEILVNKYQESAPFNINYFKKENGGKHSALNLGFNKAKKEWIFIVDSDDWLKSNTIEQFYYEIQSLTDEFNSISILKIYEDGRIIGNKFPNNINTYLDRIYNNILGDKADLIRKKALEGFSFPEYTGENFMAESPIFIWLGSRGKTKFINFGGYICKYLEGGLSDNSIINRHRCFNSSLFVYETQYNAFHTFKLKSKAAINWWRFRFFKKISKPNICIPFIYSPFGLILYFKDKINGKTKNL